MYKISISPYFLVFVGLVLDFLGAVLISYEAFNLKVLLDEYRKDEKSGVKWGFTKLDYVSFFNQLGVFIIINIICVILMIFVFKLEITIALLLFPVGFFVWKYISLLSKTLHDIVYKIKPKHKEKKGCFPIFINTMIYMPLILSWSLLLLVTLIIYSFTYYLVDIPIRAFSEFVLGRLLIKFFDFLQQTIEKQSKGHVKRPTFIGAVFLAFGLTYQIIGTILLFS